MEQSHHGRVGYEDNIPWNYTHTMAGELAKAGYYTQCIGKMHVHPLRNYLGFHHVDLHDGYLHSARYGSVPFRESQLVADDYFYWLKKNWEPMQTLPIPVSTVTVSLRALGHMRKNTTPPTGSLTGVWIFSGAAIPGRLSS